MSNLVKHVKICSASGDIRPQQQLMSTFASGSTYTCKRMCTLLLRWVTSRHWPMFIVGDPEFLDIIKMLNPQAVTPSRNTDTQDIKTMYSMTKANMKNMLQASIQFYCSPITILTGISEETKGAVHIALNAWTNINMTVWLGITLYTVQEDGYKKIPLDFIW